MAGACGSIQDRNCTVSKAGGSTSGAENFLSVPVVANDSHRRPAGGSGAHGRLRRVTTIAHAYRYAAPSGFAEAAGPHLTLATVDAAGAHPHFFDGRMRRPRLV